MEPSSSIEEEHCEFRRERLGVQLRRSSRVGLHFLTYVLRNLRGLRLTTLEDGKGEVPILDLQE